MNIWIRRGLQLSVFSAGMFALGAGIASAADSGTGGGGILDPVGQALSAPISVADNSISILGDSQTGATATQATDDGADGSRPLITVPVAVQGNAIAVGGVSDTAGTAETSPATTPAGASSAQDPGGTLISASVDASGNAVSVLGGATAGIPDAAGGAGTANDAAAVAAPVTVTDNSVAVLGRSGAATAPAAEQSDAPAAEVPAPSDGDATVPPDRGASLIDAPVTVCGTAASVLGDSASACAPQTDTSGNGLVAAPVKACGTTAAVLGDSASACAPQTDTSGSSLVAAPVSVCGTSIGVLAGATSACPTYVAADYPQSPAEPIVGDTPAAPGAEGNAAGSPARPSVPGVGTEPEQPNPATIEPEAASESLSPGALPADATAGDLAYTGVDLAGLLAAGMLALLVGAGGTIGFRSRPHPRPVS